MRGEGSFEDFAQGSGHNGEVYEEVCEREDVCGVGYDGDEEDDLEESGDGDEVHGYDFADSEFGFVVDFGS